MRNTSTSKFHLTSVIILLSVFNLFLTLYFSSGNRNYTPQEIRVISWIAIVEVLITLVLWKKMTGELLSPFLVVFFSTVFFSMGQIFGWGLGLNMGDHDLQTYIPEIGMHYVGESLVYTLDGIILFLLGATISYTGTHRVGLMTEDSEKNEIDKEAIKIVSTILLIISIPAFLINSRNVLSAVRVGGYSEMYTELNSYSQMEQFLPLLSGWLPIALLMKYAIYCKSKRDYTYISLVGLGIYIFFNLFLGGRSGVVMIVLAFLTTKHFLGTPFTKKTVIPCVIIGYFGIGLLDAIRRIRMLAGRGLFDVLSAFDASSVVGSIIGEIGWSMSSLAWTMRLISEGEPFRYGTSYLYAITAIIPNLGFWREHPAVKANLGLWMQNNLGRTSGLGYTFVAETYINFAWWGLIVMLILGYGLGKIMGSVTKETAKYNYKATFFLIMLISVLLKPFVRSSFSAIMRQLVFTVILINVLISITAITLNKNRKRE